MTLRQTISSIPIVGSAARALWKAALPLHHRLVPFRSPNYWEARYAKGGNSGSGSYGHLAEFKADVLNKFVVKHEISSVIEFGCGDGNQLLLARYPEYVGLDVSPTAVRQCQQLFKHDASKRFAVIGPDRGDYGRADLVLSLDVIYHLVEDEVYERYMHGLFDAADRFVIIYSDNEESPTEDLHVRHRRFTDWIENNRPNWHMVEHIPNQLPSRPDHDRGSWSDFWIFANAESNYTGDAP